jgi:hypothetical protein
MIKIIKDFKKGILVKKELENLLTHEDYLVELERYNNAGGPRGGFSKEEFIEFFMNIHKLQYEDIENVRLKGRLEKFKYFIENIEQYEDKLKLLEGITVEKVKGALKKTQYGLPDSIKLDEVKLIFSIGLGPSGGWFYKNYSQYDVILFLENFSEEVMLNTIAHEYHHVGLSQFSAKLDQSKYTLEDSFYEMFSGEGLAIKYCNNYNGIISKAIYNENYNVGVMKYSYQYFMEEFSEIYKMFLSDLADIRSGKISTNEELMKIIIEHWMTLRSNRVKENEPDDLEQSLNYFLGAEIWGLIHDVYGKDKVYEILASSGEFIKYYNQALIRVGREDLIIPDKKQ